MFRRIVVCLDGQSFGERAGEVAIETAARFGSGLTFVTVLPKVVGDAEAPENEDESVPTTSDGRSLQEVLEEAQGRAQEHGVPTTERVFLRGSPAEAILQYLADETPDLVVVGTRGLSRGSRLLLGSVSSRLVTDAPCPVLVVRNVVAKKRTSTPAPGGSAAA